MTMAILGVCGQQLPTRTRRNNGWSSQLLEGHKVPQLSYKFPGNHNRILIFHPLMPLHWIGTSGWWVWDITSRCNIHYPTSYWSKLVGSWVFPTPWNQNKSWIQSVGVISDGKVWEGWVITDCRSWMGNWLGLHPTSHSCRNILSIILRAPLTREMTTSHNTTLAREDDHTLLASGEDPTLPH